MSVKGYIQALLNRLPSDIRQPLVAAFEALQDPTLNATGVTAGTYGNSTAVAQFTVQADGRITSAANVSISSAVSGSVGGGGTILSTTAGGATGSSGTLNLATDGPVLERYSGTQWEPWGPVFPLTAPISSQFAWVNQGPASVSTANGGIYLLDPAAAGVNYRMREKAVPAGSTWSVSIVFIPDLAPLNWNTAGMYLRDSVSSRILAWVREADRVQVRKLDNPTTFNSTPFNWQAWSYSNANLVCLRMARASTTITLSVSFDQVHWRTVYSETSTAWLVNGADKVGVVVNANEGNEYAGMLLLSYKEA